MIHHGDARAILPTLPAASVDAMVTDPPAGIEFMGKDWDTFKQGRLANYRSQPGGTVQAKGVPSAVLGERLGELPPVHQRANRRCQTCRHYEYSGTPCRCEQPDWAIDTSARATFIAAMVPIFTECRRVLKPGAHALVWALPRTSHWTATALEDAGFEIRDVVVHLYGQGFPKSLDVGKALDRRRQDEAATARVATYLCDALARSGKNRSEIDTHFGTANVGQYWFSPHRNAQVPAWDKWLWLKEWLGLPDAMDAEVWRLNGRKGQPGDAWYEREVVGIGTAGLGKGRPAHDGGYKPEYNETAPATDLARQWDGWHTALKPAHEMWILAQAPHDVASLCVIILQSIGTLEKTVWQDSDTTSEAGTLASMLAAANISLNTVSSWKHILADACDLASRSITATVSDLITELRTLSCWTLRLTQAITTPDATAADGLQSCAVAVAESFNAFAARLRVIRMLSATDDATSLAGSNAVSDSEWRPSDPATPQVVSDSPASEHWILCRAPLAAPTVAANVAKYGTGALNIDASRIGTEQMVEGRVTQRAGGVLDYNGRNMNGSTWRQKPNLTPAVHTGRWPPNVALSHTLFCEPVGVRRVRGAGNGETKIYPPSTSLGLLNDDGWQPKPVAVYGYAAPDGTETVEAWACAAGCPVALLDAQSGAQASTWRAGKRPAGTLGIWRQAVQPETVCGGYPDTGGASRFMYIAKASAAERSRGLPDGERNTHPTVKPLALMKWLLTLITPPGGTVLDPFAGSGSTLVAAAELGIEAIGIEQDAQYVETARQRVGAEGTA